MPWLKRKSSAGVLAGCGKSLFVTARVTKRPAFSRQPALSNRRAGCFFSTLLVLVAGGLLCAAAAHADDRVLLLEAPGQAGLGLASALAVQLIGVAELERQVLPDAATVPARVRAARELGQERHALLVVWAEGPVELADGSQEAVLYAVGQREGRALLEVVRVAGGRGPDMDRTLALKVREMVDELHRNRAQTPSEAMLQPEPTPPSPRGPRPQFGAELALGALGSPALGAAPARLGTAVALGPALLLRALALRLSARAELAWFPPNTVERGGAHVRFDELVPGLALRGQLRQGPLWLGARAGFALALTAATGVSAAGAKGVAHEQTALWLAGLELELPLAAGLGLLLGVELQARFLHRRFAVNGTELVDLGALRPFASLALTWSAPRMP